MLEIFAKRLKKLREQNGLTIAQLSAKLGISVSTLRRWEKGKTTTTANNLFKLAKFFNVKSNYFIGLKD